MPIVQDTDILFGKPRIQGTRIPVALILDLCASGMGAKEIVEEYPDITEQDIYDCLRFAKEHLEHEITIITSSPSSHEVPA